MGCWDYLDKGADGVIREEDFETFVEKTERSQNVQLRDKLLATPSFYASCCYMGSAFTPFFIKNQATVVRVQRALIPAGACLILSNLVQAKMNEVRARANTTRPLLGWMRLQKFAKELED